MSCNECPFAGRTQVRGYGASPENCRGVLIGEAPGRTEARQGKPFVGESGQLLRSILTYVGFDVPSCSEAQEGTEHVGNVYFTNAAMCMGRRSDTTTARRKAALCCKKRLTDELCPYRNIGVPVCALGATAALALTGDSSIAKMRGRWHDGGKVLTTWHPSFILRQPNVVGDLLRDMQRLHHGGPRTGLLPEVQFWVIDNVDDLHTFTNELLRMVRTGQIVDNTVSIDIETDSVNWQTDTILSIQIAWSDSHAVVIADKICYSKATTEVLKRLFDPTSGIKWVGHNVKFDLKFLIHQLNVVNARADYDTILGCHILDENGSHGLKELLYDHYDLPDYETHLLGEFLSKSKKNYSRIPRPILYQYGALDAAYTLRLWQDIRQELIGEGLFDRPFIYPVMTAYMPLMRMELRGMHVCATELLGLSRELSDHLNKLRSNMEQMCGRTFNPNSYRQVGNIMYQHYNMPVYKAKTKVGWSTAAEYRARIVDHFIESGHTPDTHEPYKWLLLYNQWKTLEKLRGSYVDNLVPLVKDSNRVHPDIRLYGTKPGRISVRDPALQTIPRKGTGEAAGAVWGVRIKRCFTAPSDDYVIVQADYSQAEMRTAAWLSQDTFLLQVYSEGIDIHGEVAEAWWPGWKDMHHDDTRDIPVIGTLSKADMRNYAKRGVFARMYLGTEYAIAGILGIPPGRARPYLAKVDALLKGLVGWEQQQFELLRRHGYVETLTGRRRRVPLITRNNVDDARKTACNAPVQAMASDLTLMSLIEVCDWLENTGLDTQIFPVMTVHDSILLEAPVGLAQSTGRVVKRMMEQTANEWLPGIPWIADVEIGKSWGDLKPLVLEQEEVL